MKNVLMVAYYFPPRGGVAGQRSAKFARYLPEFGYRPLVLTVAEQDIAFPLDHSLVDELQDTDIIRCPHNKGRVVQLLEKFRLRPLVTACSLPDKGVFAWVPQAKREAIRIARQQPLDIIYTSVSPYSSIMLGYWLKKQLSVPWVVDFRDPWTDNAARQWLTRLHYWLESHQESRALRLADAIIVVTPTMRELLVERYPHLADRIHLIYNGYDRSDIPPSIAPSKDDCLNIACAARLADYGASASMENASAIRKLSLGFFSYHRVTPDLSTRSPYYLLQAVRALLDEYPQLTNRIKLTFAGVFGENNLNLVRQLGLEDVFSYKGFLPHRQAIRLLAESDILFLPIDSNKEGQRSFNLSGKVFEYLAVGRPILAAVPEGDLRDLIKRTRSGWWVEPRDVPAIKTLLKELIDKKVTGALSIDPDKDTMKRFERRELTGQLAALFDSLGPQADRNVQS